MYILRADKAQTHPQTANMAVCGSTNIPHDNFVWCIGLYNDTVVRLTDIDMSMHVTSNSRYTRHIYVFYNTLCLTVFVKLTHTYSEINNYALLHVVVLYLFNN